MVAHSLSLDSLSLPNTSGRRAGGSPCLAPCDWKEHGGERLAMRHRGSEPPNEISTGSREPHEPQTDPKQSPLERLLSAVFLDEV